MGSPIAERVLEFADHLAGRIGPQPLKADGLDESVAVYVGQTN